MIASGLERARANIEGVLRFYSRAQGQVKRESNLFAFSSFLCYRLDQRLTGVEKAEVIKALLA